MTDNLKNSDLPRLIELWQQLEKRIARIEDYLEIGSPAAGKTESGKTVAHNNTESIQAMGRKERSLEFKIGEYWLAQVGAFVLMLGVAFFVSYPFEAIPPLFVSLIGYLSVAGIFGLSKFWHKTYQYLSKILFGSSLVLGYYVTLRLHFFNNTPVLANKTAGLVFTTIALILIFYQVVRRRSELLTGLALFLCYLTGLFSDATTFTFILIILTATASAYVLIEFNWLKAFIFSIILSYLTHMIWMVNNPLLGKPMQAVLEHQNNIIYLFAYGLVFSLANLFRRKDAFTDISELIMTFINSTGLFVVGSLSVFTFHKTDLALMNFIIAAFFIIIAASNWMRHKSKYASSVYSCFGYLALSIAILAQFKAPQYFIWLSLQSLLVISTALWFHSRIIIVVNFLIYLGILLAYLGITVSNSFVNLSYALVALVSARILNWKKERLELKTELMRNAYLASAFVIVLYGLYHAVPGDFVALSWLGAALFYFAVSLLLRNVKYRWMAILTIFATVVHVFFVDLAKVEAAFRIILFLAVGVVLLIVSFLYSKIQNKEN